MLKLLFFPDKIYKVKIMEKEVSLAAKEKLNKQPSAESP